MWFWFHWPWIGLWQGSKRLTRFVLKNTLEARLGLRLSDFRCAVDIADVLDRKREALNEHASQVTRLIDDPGWQTLGDLAHGDFLMSLLQDREIFRLHEVPAAVIDGNRPAATR